MVSGEKYNSEARLLLQRRLQQVTVPSSPSRDGCSEMTQEVLVKINCVN